MTGFVAGFERAALALVWAAAAVAASMLLAVVVQRILHVGRAAWVRRVKRTYEPLLARALAGDEGALRELARSPSRHRLTIARMVMGPLVENRDPARIAAGRAVVLALELVPFAVSLLKSRSWWRRSVGVRALGLFQVPGHTDKLVAALDDPNSYVRDTALDALADLQDPASLPALVVRLHDASLSRGRRLAALAAFGSSCEPFLLELAEVDPEQRVNYARALLVCGGPRSRAALGQWVQDARAEVRAAAFDTLAHVGLDEPSAALAVAALESDEAAVRAAAAGALRGWRGSDAAARLGRHLDDAWPVAVRAARALQAMGEGGRAELEARAASPDVAGELARQMLWESGTRA